jgi:uncharacterized lipoprotein YbaY
MPLMARNQEDAGKPSWRQLEQTPSRTCRGSAAQGTPIASAAARVAMPNANPTGAESMAEPVTVTGTIVFSATVSAGPSATIHVRIEDASHADTPATTLARATLEAVTVPPPAGERVTFAVPVEAYDPRRRYTLRVHIDRDGDGRVSAGDLVSTDHLPVLTAGAGTEVTVPVSLVSHT